MTLDAKQDERNTNPKGKKRGQSLTDRATVTAETFVKQRRTDDVVNQLRCRSPLVVVTGTHSKPSLQRDDKTQKKR